jgi:hypothetical protein
MNENDKKGDADDVYDHRNDAGEWSSEPVKVDVRSGRTAVISCRLPRNELDALEEAAEAANESVSEYVRKAITVRRQVEGLFLRRPSESPTTFGPGQLFVLVKVIGSATTPFDTHSSRAAALVSGSFEVSLR